MMSEEKKKQGGLNMSDLSRALPSYAPGLSSADRVGLVNALKNKLQSLAGKNTDVVEALSPKVKRRIEALKEIQAQHDELEAKFREERAALEAIYEKIYEPLYSKRYDIVNGLVEVENVLNANSEVKGVPDFWLTALRTNDVLSEEIQERDDDALKYLKDIKASKLTDSKGFKLDFFFDSNPFFKNSVLSKTYYMIDDEDPILEKATGTKIEWYPGKCLTRKILKKRPKKGSKNSKPITKTEICKSFFNFFSPPLVPEENEEIEEEAAAQLQEQMEQDYDIGSTIQNKIIPHAVSWFTGEAAQEKSTDVEDGDEDDTDEEDDDTDEYEDEEEEEEVAKRRKKPSSASKKAGKGEEADYSPECKQQ